jgi:hypothetical protein
MVSVSEALNSKPPLGAALAAGVKTLSMDQQLSFSLYRKYVFPLDGMVYWIKVSSTLSPVTTAGIQLQPGIALQTRKDGEAIQVVPGNQNADDIVGGTITNPLTAADQGLDVAESLFVDFTGPAFSYVTGTTAELDPGESIDIPANCTNGAWVCAASGGHHFSCTVQMLIDNVTLPTDISVQGSFHYATKIEQEEDSTYDTNEVIFTSLSEVQEFNQIGPDFLYICSYGDIRFAFSSRHKLYEQADLYHYRGNALFSKSATQIIDDPSQFNPTLIVSNSLPIWLYMPIYVPPYPGFTCPVPLYPSYLVDDNLPPPFGSVHIEETSTLEMSPFYGPRLQSASLCRDLVKVHLYGTDNLTSDNFVAFVQQYSRDWMTIGMANSPNVKDEKSKQSELRILSQHKTVEFLVNYLQGSVRDVFRQFILHARVQFYQPHWLTDSQ